MKILHLLCFGAIFMPLIGAFISGILALESYKPAITTDTKLLYRKFTIMTSCGFMMVSSLAAASIFYLILSSSEAIHFMLSEWFSISTAKIYWSIYIDRLSAIMVFAVNLISLVVHIYSIGYMHDDQNIEKFLSFLSLFTFCMLMLVVSDNILQLFFGWEGVGLCSYLLIGFWYKKSAANKAAIKAFIVNRVADFGFILGIILLVLYTGHSDFNGIFSNINLLQQDISIWTQHYKVIDIACMLLFIGCMGKSAQIGLHIWLPDAMEGPTPVSALIHAATMVTAGVFLLIRCSYIFEYSTFTLQFITIVGSVTCLFAATIAIAQKDIKKIIAYSTCSQLGYMFFACGLSLYQTAMFHLLTHAFFKALLFLSAGSVIHSCHEQNIFNIGGLRSKMPITYVNFWMASLALIGIFPLAGFYSKDAILLGAYEIANSGVSVSKMEISSMATNNVANFAFILGIIAACLTAIYSGKIIMLVFHGKTRLRDEVFNDAHEVPKNMNLPLMILVAGSLFSGTIGHHILQLDKIYGYFASSIYNAHYLASHALPITIELMPMLVGILGVVIATLLYQYNLYSKISDNFIITKILQNKYYIDEIYDIFIIRVTKFLSATARCIDVHIIDRLGPNGLAFFTKYFSIRVSSWQTGYLTHYNLYIILFVIIVINYIIFTVY